MVRLGGSEDGEGGPGRFSVFFSGAPADAGTATVVPGPAVPPEVDARLPIRPVGISIRTGSNRRRLNPA